MKYKAIAVVGPTATGKTKLGVRLAAKFNGEIVSADSRQVYKYLDIATGKDKEEYSIKSLTPPARQRWATSPQMRGGRNQIFSPSAEGESPPVAGEGVGSSRTTKIPYHLIDILEPSQEITVADFQKKAFSAIDDIIKRKKLPIIVGGSPFYVYSITEGWQFPKFEKNTELRKKLNKLSISELRDMLQKIDPRAYGKIDADNPRRLMRAIEVCLSSGKDFSQSRPKSEPKYNFLYLGITFPNEILKQKIQDRLKKRLKQGMIEEIANIIKQKKATYQDLERMGMEPKFISFYLQNKINKAELEELIVKNNYLFAKRQMTWFRKDKRINWVKNIQEAEKMTRKFLSI